MTSWWTNITEGQGAVLSALITVFAAGLGVLLGWTLFSRQVLSLKGAVDKAKEHLDSYRSAMNSTLEGVRRDLEELKRYSREVGSSVSDLQSMTTAAANPQEAEEKVAQREAIQQDWYVIRNCIERIITSAEINEEDKAKYQQFDRRRGYSQLVDAMAADGLLDNAAADYSDAANLWAKYRTGRATPTGADVDKMDALRIKLVPGER